MLSREGKQTDRGAVGAEFIGYNRRRREALLLQEFPHQPNCRPSVPAGLNQEIQDFALTVHGTPEIELPPSNYDDHLVQVPAFGRSWPPTLNPPRIGPTEFQDPSSNCLIRDVETTLGKQVLNVPIAQRETAIEPDGMLDDDRWKAVTTVGYLAHPETLKHRPCRSHAVNVTMPFECLMVSLRVGERAIPVAWRVKQTQGGIGFSEQEPLLDAVAAMIPQGVSILLAADRFYGTSSLIRWCQNRGWKYRIRLKKDLILLHQGGEITTGDAARAGIAALTDARLNESGVLTHIGILHENGHKEPWVIAMDEVPSKGRVLDYGMRWGIEPMFSDFKSRGFSITKTQLRHADRIERLLLILTVALYWAVSTGMAPPEKPPTRSQKKQRGA